MSIYCLFLSNKTAEHHNMDKYLHRHVHYFITRVTGKHDRKIILKNERPL